MKQFAIKHEDKYFAGRGRYAFSRVSSWSDDIEDASLYDTIRGAKGIVNRGHERIKELIQKPNQHGSWTNLYGQALANPNYEIVTIQISYEEMNVDVKLGPVA